MKSQYLNPSPVDKLINDGLTYVNKTCLNCHRYQLKMVKLNENGAATQTFTGCCTNRHCFKFTDPENLKTWKVVGGFTNLLKL